ncbi:CHAT domain-containing tetratricopeptide repeat protein [Laspinema olomoucense]|uniref:CHAT domain-containing tetratricopeptide repeat protein n=1 Tax=Laspinema olomoucense TaxID=3231600 RepID=UPI0021BB0BE6|nr:CHAT domain-containing protein [Laspinema sp. D3c]MCT7994807.1 CHAT domain-containing protein [Laspinema sp. D3c]
MRIKFLALVLGLMVVSPVWEWKPGLVSGVIAQTAEERKEEADRLFGLGVEQYQRSLFSEASVSWEQALEIYRAIADKEGEARSLNNLAEVYRNWAEYARAEYYLLDSLEIAQDVGDKATEARSLHNLGEVYYHWAEYARAEHYLEQSLEIAQALGDKALEGRILASFGAVYLSLAEYARAEYYLQQSLEIAQQLGDKALEGRVLGSFGAVYVSLAEYARAEYYLQQSLEITQEIGDRAGEGKTLGSFAEVYLSLAEYARAEHYLRQSLEIAEAIGDKAAEGNILATWGTIYHSWGEYAQAEEFYRRSLEIARLIGNKVGQGNTLLGLGLVYFNLGEYVKAEAFYRDSLEIKRLIGDKAGQGNLLSNLGNIYWQQGDSAQAEEFYLNSLEIKRLIGDKAGEGSTLSHLGTVYRNRGEYDKAEEFYQQSIEIARLIGDEAGEGNSLNHLGMVYFNRGEYAKAEEFYRKSLEIAKLIGNQVGESSALQNLGMIYQNRGEYPQAEQSYFASIEASEELRPGLTDEQKISLFEQQAKTYERLQKVLILQNKTETALKISERGRARAFVELLAARLGDSVENSGMVPPPNLSEIKQIAVAQNATIVQYSLIRDRPLEAPAQTFLESELYIWVIQPNGEIIFRRTDLKPLLEEHNAGLTQIIADARCFDNFLCRRHLRIAQSREGTPEVRSDRPSGANQSSEPPTAPPHSTENRQLKKLHQLLIEPIADLLPTNPTERVIFIPQGSLFLVPFPALPNATGEYLIEKHTLLTAPSIQALNLIREQKQARTAINQDILIVGNPIMPVVTEGQLSPLLGAEQEARDIGQLLNISPLIGPEATKATVIQKMLSSRIIHLATHGSFDSNVPLDSWLALTPEGTDNGLLTAAEIFGLQLNPELVVLSACDTGRGKITGDGVVGLSRAFLSAGAPAVLVSLWQVPDDSTSVLMREFYTLWQGRGDKAQALRQAMLTTMQQYPNPVNWAAFTLMGEAE